LSSTLIINHSGFYQPLLKELERIGYKAIWNNWKPSDDEFEGVRACFVWFYDCIRYPIAVWILRNRLRKHNIPLIAWNRDAPHYLNRKKWRLDLLDRVKLLDIYATHTLIDDKRSFADMVMYLPNAADVNTYNPCGEVDAVFQRLRDRDSYQWDVSFFGGMNGKKYKEDVERASFFAALSKRLVERGISYRFQESEGMSVEEQIEFIHASRINLNFGARCEYGAPIASGLPERCYGIPACGGFLLCDQRTHARDDFELGVNWAEFDGADDCVRQIEYWLRNFQQARDLAERCYWHVQEKHTYRQRAEKLHTAIEAWHSGQRGLIK
jgi:spore maturation protein CgeB